MTLEALDLHVEAEITETELRHQGYLCQREVKMSNFFYLLKYEKHEGVDLFENCLMVPGE